MFYWSEKRFIFREKENYGDLISPYLVEKISGKKTVFVHPKKQKWYNLNKSNLLAVGSIIHHAIRDSVIWGSGIIDNKQFVRKADFRAVRGPRTREQLLKFGYDCPDIFGDPAILLPKYFSPNVTKKYRLGIIPHYHDYKAALQIFGKREGIQVVNLLTLDVEGTTREILQCERILSTSLHGLIVAHSYGIPAIRVKISNDIFGNEVKYADYLESVGLANYRALEVRGGISDDEISDLFRSFPALVPAETIEFLRVGLLETKPF